MHTVSKTLYVLILLSSACTAVASPEGDEHAVAQIAAPDVSSWSRVEDGLYQGLGKHGEAVTLFVGAQGMELLLAQRQQELDEAHAELHVMAAEGGVDLDGQRQRIRDLEVEIEHLEDYLAEATESISIEASQTVSLPSQTVCGGWVMYGTSQFTASPGAIDQPVVTATFNPFGSGFQIGPTPPMPPNTFRSVSVKVQDVTGYLYSYDRTVPLSVTRNKSTVGGSCNMETTHTVSAHCTLSSPPTGWAVTRRQTCAGVINGTPPL